MYNPDAEVTIKLRELKEILDEHQEIPVEDAEHEILDEVYNRSLIAECLKRR